MEVIALMLFVAALMCWRWSFNAESRLVATVRWWLAVALLVMGLVAGLSLVVG